MLKVIADELPRLITCNGSRLMGSAVPETADNSHRDDGTAAHYMAMAVFNNQHSLEELIDRKAPNGVYMTSEMAEHVENYLALINSAPVFTQQVYTRAMEIDTSHDFSPIWVVNGRCDFYEHNEHGFHFVDFKYGWSIVEPENHWTLISHAIGYCKQNPQKIHPHAVFKLSVFQPRPYHPDGPLRSWDITLGALQRLEQQLTKTLSQPSDELVTSLAHCKHCQALAICPAARQAEMNAIDAAEMAYEDNPNNDLLSFNLDNLNRAMAMLKARLDASEELAKHRMKEGQVIPNYSVTMGYGNSRWKEGISADTLKMLTGKDLSTAKLVTPAEAKRRGVDETVVKALTERIPTGLKIERVKASKKGERLLGSK